MSFFEKIVYANCIEIEKPTVFSPFHIVSFLLMALTTIGISLWFAKCKSDKTIRIFTLVCWIVMVLFECYKHVVYSFSYEQETGVKWDYAWHTFPFQLCSSPLYILPFLVFLKEGKVRDAFLSYICTFSLFGGLVVMIYPGTVFDERVMIDIQSMVHHSIQCILGVSLVVFYRKKFTWKFFSTGIIVYIGMITVAQILNAILPSLVKEEFNMFYISWKYDCILPLLEMVYANTPYLVFFLIYLLGFVLISSIIFAIIWGILRLIDFIKKKRGTPATVATVATAEENSDERAEETAVSQEDVQ